MTHSVNKNLPILYIIKISQWIMLYMPIVKLYYEENGLNNTQLFLLHGIYSIIIAVSEIPSGYAADVWGRKISMIIGLLFGTIGFALYSVTYGFWGFLFAEVLLGIGEGFTSGCDTALLYDSLQQQGKENDYIKHEGRITSVGNVSEALAGIMVTLLAFSVMRNYYYIQTIISIFGLIAAFFLVEPTLHHEDGIDRNWNHIIEIVKQSLWKNKLLSYTIIFSSVIGFASLSMAWFAQIFMFNAHLPARYYGITWTSLNLFVAAGSFMSFWIYRKVGLKSAAVMILVLISGGFILASQTISILGIALLAIFYFTRGAAHPILKDRINNLTQSSVRATVLSIRSFIIRILFFALGPLLGFVTDKINLSTALLLGGITVLIPALFYLPLIIKNENFRG